jgi:RNA 2',3'-cyclic 3'-phosphodiesterase
MRALEGKTSERLFVGIPVTANTGHRIESQLPAQLPGRMAPTGNWHFTLRFLGSTDPDMRDRLIDELRSIALPSAFDISFDTLGAVPKPGRARVLWVGVGHGREKLEGVAANVESASRAAGFPAEPRGFTPHLTIARIKQPQSVTALLASAKPVNATMHVGEVILYRSEMGKGHSLYTPIERFNLDD